jgi:hypothetical protein
MDVSQRELERPYFMSYLQLPALPVRRDLMVKIRK